jgi:hypothetical protein
MEKSGGNATVTARPILLAFRMELRLLCRERSALVLLGVFGTLTLYATAAGVAEWKAAQDNVARAGVRTTRLASKWKAEVATGRLTSSGARGSKADNPYFASAQRLSYAVPPHPLGMMEVSALKSRTWTDDLSAWTSKPDLFRHDDLANPLLLQAGSLDTNLIAVFLLPLILAALAMRGQVQDRTDEIHRWMQTLSGQGGHLLLGKLLAAGTLALAPLWTSWAISAGFSLVHGSSAAQVVVSGLLWLALVTSYAVCILGLVAWLARISVDASAYLMRVASLWMCLALLAPLTRVVLLNFLTPAPDAAQAAVQRQGLDTRMGTLRGTAVDYVRNLHPDWFGGTSGDAREVAILSSFLMAEEESLRNNEGRRVAARDRALLSQRLAWLSPCLLLSDALQEVSGTGEAYFDNGRDRVYSHLREVRILLFPMILQGERLVPAVYDRLPVSTAPPHKPLLPPSPFAILVCLALVATLVWISVAKE